MYIYPFLFHVEQAGENVERVTDGDSLVDHRRTVAVYYEAVLAKRLGACAHLLGTFVQQIEHVVFAELEEVFIVSSDYPSNSLR